MNEETTVHQFIVIELDEGELLHAFGRCGRFDIAVGDEFTVAKRFREPKSLEELAFPLTLEWAVPVSLRVWGIEAYDHKLNDLPSGMTGTLTLVGDGIEHIGPDVLLEGAPVPVANQVTPAKNGVLAAAAKKTAAKAQPVG